MQGVTTAVGVMHGFTSSLFAVSLCFSLIVMYDAAGVRRHAGSCPSYELSSYSLANPIT